MAFETGTRLGPYEILSPLSDDASESYKATDTRLNRTVTIKVFPPYAADNPDARQRLEREIKTVAALNHPHICALYDVGREGDRDYLVSEYQEGETLSSRLSRGPMELEEALRVAISISDALDKAHRQGVIHRGLNLSTVLMTAAGAKLADFGFARLSEPSRVSSTSTLSTRTSVAPAVAIAASAAPYLAPEQYDGMDSDARTDIFALGAVLYEMVTGRPAFEGKTQPQSLAAIQTVDPEPMSKFQPMTPPALEYVVKRCLAKDPKQRLQTARDLLSHLRWIAEGGSQTGIPAIVAARRRKRDRLFWIGAAVMLFVIAGLAPSAYRYFEGASKPDAVHFGVYSMPNTAQGAGGTGTYISPDGRWIAASRPATARGMYLLAIGSVTPKLILEDHAIYGVFWSPDSRSFAFFDDGKLFVTDISGTPPRIVCEAPFPIGGGTWGPDGVILFSSAGALYRVLAAGGQPEKITSSDPDLQKTEHDAPYFLPDGRHFVFLSSSSEPAKSGIYVGSLGSTETTRLFSAESHPLYAAPGYLLFNRQSAVFAQPFDAETLQLTGEPRRITDANLKISVPQSYAASFPRTANFDVSQTGVLVYRTGSLSSAADQTGGGPSMTLTWFNREGNVEQVAPPGTYAGVDMAPDGKRFAVHKHEAGGGDSWFFDAGRLQRLTFNVAQDNSMPVWSRDGKRIAFGSQRNGKWGIYVKASDGTGTEELLLESDVTKTPMSWSRDDKWVVYGVTDPKTRGDIWMVSLEGKHEATVLVQSTADEILPVVSPDGKWMAYQSSETTQPQIYVAPFPDSAGNKFQISTDGGIWPRWRGDSRELYYVWAPNMLAADIRVTGESVQPSIPRVLFPLRGNPNVPHGTLYHHYAVTADGQRFLVPQPANIPVGSGGGLSGTIASAVDSAASGSGVRDPGAINVLVNWTRVLDRK